METPVIKKEVMIPPYEGRAIEVKKGESLCIIDVEGKQVGDFLCFNQREPTEYVSPVHMRSSLSSVRLCEGDGLYSNQRRPLMRLVKDTVSRHDFFFPACDDYRYRVDFGVENHPNCHDNLTQAIAGFGIRPMLLPDPINWFMNNELDDEWDYEIKEPLSRPGDYVKLKALMDVVVAVSTCSQDMAPVNGWKVTPLKLQLLAKERDFYE
ncbi:hypothetical protein SAMN05444487_101294 [Marininema mesophilum]|uniref:DUF1989 domain-containing protein n=1 Tax=Marininema mesophilum TaxID=1048340 RepID=A0A1H2QTZ5_9BACL|nr:urea carboxylase-associated family protein [Marininema mesophilum]SDW10114.1 hypothetical protein SAMN05444487_101294 [Marininema mesophilum]